MPLFQKQLHRLIKFLNPYPIWEKFKSWMKYNPPPALSMGRWSSFEDEYRQCAPIRYAISNFFETKLPNFFDPITHRYSTCMRWIKNRTIHRHHVISTGLPPGYYDLETQMLHSSFNLLKDFVEKEQAWKKQCWGEGLTWKEKLPLYYEFFYRKPEVGIAYYEWESTLDDPNLLPGEQSVRQAENGREILALYLWWTVKRPARVEIELIEYSDQGLMFGPLHDDFNHSATDYEIFLRQYKDSEEQREFWHNEDTEMLIRLTKIRKYLWT